MRTKNLKRAKVFGLNIYNKKANALLISVFICMFIASYWLHFEPLILVFLCIFPGSFIIPFKKANCLFAAPMIFGLSLLYIALSTTLLNMFGVPISLSSVLITTLLGSSAALVIMSFRPPKQSTWELFDSVDNSTLIPVYILFIFAVISRVMSVFDAPVPLVHDPEAHAFWALRIINEKSINYFYSPGLHIWAALISLTTNLDLARVINILTNLLSSLTVLYWGIAGFVVSKKKTVGLFTAFFVLIAPIPTNLYYLAGKNSLIAALPFFGVLIIVSHLYLKKPTYYAGLLLVFTLAGIGIIHYPAFVYATSYTLLLFLIYKLRRLNKAGLINSIQRYILMILPVLCSVVIVGAVMVVTNSRGVKVQVFASSSTAQAFHHSPALSENTRDRYKPPITSAERGLIPHNPVKQVMALPNVFASFINKTSENLGMILAGLIILMLYFLINDLKTNRFKKPETIAAAALLLSALSVILALKIVQIKTFDLVPETGIFLIFIISSLGLAIMLDSINKFGYFATCCVILVLGGCTSYQIFQRYSLRSTKFSLVNSSDVKAFSWIKANVPKDSGFVGLSKLNPTRNQIVFPVDGSLWLPVFTGNPISTPNQDSGFVAVKSHINYEYMLLLNKGPEAQKQSLRYFLNNGFHYIYVDGDQNNDRLGVKSLVDSKLVKTVYENSEVKILKINALNAL